MKKSRILSILLAVALLASMFAMVLPANAAPSGIHIRSRTNYTCYSDEQLMDLLKVDLDTLHKMRLDAAHAAMTNTDWNVSAYKVARNSTAASALFELLYSNPELFFVSGVSYSYSASTGNITRVSVRYTDSYEVAMQKHQAFISAAQEIICLFQRDESLTDLELALLIHDYLAANYEYDTAFATGADMYTGYGLLVNGMAVCQAYAETFAYLMMQFGVNTALCESDSLNHAWNIIELDGKEYHLDVTFDDPTYDRDGRVRHTNFLVSTTVLKANDHNATDLTATPENTEYDNAFWRDVTSSFCLFDGTIYYINASKKLCSWEDGVSTVLLSVPGTWRASGGGYWSGYYNCLATDGERLFYSSHTDIYEYFPETNTSAIIYSPTLPSGYNIYGFAVKNNNFYINTYNSPNFKANTKAENTTVYNYRDADADRHVYDDGVYTTAPTCTVGGEILYTCIYCGKNKTEAVPATGHAPAVLDAVAPNCTASGLTEGQYCSTCNEIIVAQEVIPATGHSPMVQEGSAPSCNASGLTEGQYCGTCGEVLVAQEVIPATGHSYTYADNGDGTHTGTCSACSYTLAPNSHSNNEDNICTLCGAVTPTGPVVLPDMQIFHSLNLASDISINYAVWTSLLSGYDTVYMECVLPVYEGNTLTGTRTVQLQPVIQGDYYYFTLAELHAGQMNDRVEATVIATKGNTTYHSLTDSYCIADYAYAQLRKDTISNDLKVLCADLLRYGAMTQTYKEYRTDALADSAMTEDQTAYLTDSEAVTFGNNNETLSDIPNPVITWYGKSMMLNSRITLRYVVNIGSYEGDIDQLRLKITYTNPDGSHVINYVENADPYGYVPGLYSFDFDGLLAAELRCVVSVAVYEGDTQLSATLVYSADTYGNNRTGTLLTLCKALFAYSDSAKCYFGR